MHKDNLKVYALMLFLGHAGTAVGQTDEAQTESDEFDLSSIEEVVVTANKRSEKLQEVPMSISAFTEDFLKDAGLTDFSNLEQYTPGLQITNPGFDSRSTSIRIRGIGSTGNNAGIDPSVGVFIDGVYQGRAGMSVGDLLDIERVEVLRGPQGTLYGKNTAAGAINIYSKKPDTEWEAEAEVVVGKYDHRDHKGTREFRGMVNIPLSDSGNATRLSGYRVEHEARDENPFLETEVNDSDKWGLKSRTYVSLADMGDLLLTLDYSSEDSNCCAPDVVTYAGPGMLNVTFNSFVENPITSATVPGGLPPEDVYDSKIYFDGNFSNEVSVGGMAVEWVNELDNELTLTLLAARREYESYSIFDGDFSPYDAVVADTDVDLTQDSIEFRVTSPSGTLVDYQVGAFYYDSKMDTIGHNSMGPAIAQNFEFYPFGLVLPQEGVVNEDVNEHITKSYALFGQFNWNISEKWRLTLGLRRTKERKERNGSMESNPKPAIPVDAPPILGPDIDFVQNRTKYNTSPALNLRWFPTEDVMVYASVSRGFKSGGFNQLRTFQGKDSEFNDEKSTNYEVGYKGSFMDRRLQLNATLYFIDFEDFQAQTFDGTDLSVRNAGNLESKGIEIDITAFITRNLMTGIAIGASRAEYTDFDNGECTVSDAYDDFVYFESLLAAGEPLPEGAPTPFFPDTYVFPGAVGCTVDLKGEPLDQSPELTVSTYVQYDRPLGGTGAVSYFARLEHAYTDDVHLNMDIDPKLRNDDLNVFNLRTGFRETGYQWEVLIWGENLTDEEYLSAGFDVPAISGFAGVAAPRRSYGMTLRYRL